MAFPFLGVYHGMVLLYILKQMNLLLFWHGVYDINIMWSK